MMELASPVIQFSDQAWIFVALAMVALTSLLASIAAWVLLWRDRKARPDAGTQTEPPPSS